jgi:tetratricopeptide (TPR) repeat protein
MLAKVREIAPGRLEERGGELAAMAAFCSGPTPYLWWQAEPYAGKTALLSSFVLNPPERVDVVSFFIRGAREASLSNSAAFEEAMAGQLEDLLDREAPKDPAGEHWLRLLALAQEKGRRLVLVVDGLDEDLHPPWLPSIASVLPKHCGPGLKVIVSSRRHPGIPPDVAADHPLRDDTIVRTLTASRRALVIRDAAEWELRRYLNSGAERQLLLGLLTAAQGGLTRLDLAGLTGLAPFQLHPLLENRIFTTRESGGQFLLAHDQLRAGAVTGLGDDRVEACRAKLHTWAASYQSRGWPAETPEYLLHGYFAMLASVGDLARMVACALDMDRHDRMHDLTGGDAPAMAEVRTALDKIATQEAPDVASALALACYRDHLVGRNAHIPEGLPAVWAILGQLPRAQTLAASIPGRNERFSALAEIAGALARMGQHQQAETIAEEAGAVARSLPGRYERPRALAKLAGALARAGSHKRAEVIARSIAEQHERSSALAEVAAALARAGSYERAEVIARSIEFSRERALAEIAGALAGAGLYEKAGIIAGSITDQYDRANALAQVAKALVEAGQYQEAEATARCMTYGYTQAKVLAQVAGALAGAGQHQQAETIAEEAEVIARSITDQVSRERVLAAVAKALVGAGQHLQAEAFAERAEAIARSITGRDEQSSALATVAGALAGAGRYEKAEVIVHSITDRPAQESILAKIAGGLARAGKHDQAEVIARSITGQFPQADALAQVAEALAKVGRYEEAGAIARLITHPKIQLTALVEVAQAATRAGQQQAAEAIARQTEAIARSITSPFRQKKSLAEVAEVLAAAGQHRQAAGQGRPITDPPYMAHSITDQSSRPRALAVITGMLAREGQYEHAEAIARSITDPAWQASALTQATGTRASARKPEARVLAEIAAALAMAGETHFASHVAVTACIVGRYTLAVWPVLLLVPSALTTLLPVLQAHQHHPLDPN